ncbi:hypothetical protein [Bartonella tamiae]|uniref:Uncharacterized protein n=1 Tax=Bartonella tamiae Th239 TaxID=1094558 RepID=J0ZNY3_9HYPH|nr:hypothetical protein [Bartonella tamiae]EJF90278.1 hypothetical protein ME5_00679 [Bartonella tamiae Th239]EJF93781.1 hypothetical protein MEG_01205 [Bartonella tamiae Th307]
MTNAEQAIRNALLNVDAFNQADRRRVYESAWNAHERALISNTALDDINRERRRDELMRVIRLIENEYLSQEASFNHSHSDPAQSQNNTLHALGPEDQIEIEVDGVSNNPSSRVREQIHKKRSKILIILGLGFIGFLIVIFIIWSLILSFSSQKPSEHIIETPRASSSSSHYQAVDDKKNNQEQDTSWIRIFHPNDASSVATRGAASVDIRMNAGEPYMHIFANNADDAAIISIGEGVLNKLRGQSIMFEIDAQSDGTQSSQLSITCDFGTGSECGRRRFEILSNRENILFQVSIPQNSKGAGKLYLTSDLLGEGHAINIYNIGMKASN